MSNAPKKEKSYPVFVDGDALTDDSMLLGISVKIWDAAFTGSFEKNLERGNEVMRRVETKTDRN